MIEATKAGVGMHEVVAGTSYCRELHIDKVYLDGVELASECTASYMPILPNYEAQGWLELRVRDENGNLILEHHVYDNGSGEIIRERKHGVVSWTRKTNDHTQTEP